MKGHLKVVLVVLITVLFLIGSASFTVETHAAATARSGKNASASTPPSTVPVEIKLVSAWPEGDFDNTGLVLLEKKVAKLGKGKVILKKAGGPETIPPMELGEAVRSGAVDMAWLHPAYYSTSLPESSILDYSDYNFGELLKSGAIDYINEIHHKKMNVHVIGSGDNGLGYSIYTTKPVNSISDFKGMRIRVSGSYLPFLKALKAETVTMATGEIYGALERGVIDGFTSPAIGIGARKLDELTKYKILPYYWRVVDVSIMNLDKWNAMPQDVRAILMQASREVEAELPGVVAEMQKKEDNDLKKRGILFVTIAEPDKYLQMAREAGKDRVRGTVKEGSEKIIKKFFKD